MHESTQTPDEEELMPGPVLTAASTVQCAHLGRGTPSSPNPRITILGVPVVTIATQYAIAACTFPAMTGGNSPPCVSGSFTTASTRVLTNTGFLLLADSQGTSLPNGTPLVVVPSQIKVNAI
jgi:hypothetical protein